MDSGRDAAAVRIFEDVLVRFAFLFGELRSAEDLPALEGQAWLACLPFRASGAGCLAVGVPEALAREIAANSLGVDPRDPDVPRRAQDAMKEVASVMGGHLAEALERPESPVTLFPPQIFPLIREDWNRLRTDPSTRCFSVNQHPVLFRVGPDLGGATT